MNITQETQKYYGETLQKSSDLKTNACCTLEKIPKYIRTKLKNIHPDILTTYYGCGLVVPECLENTNILDLGCGTGRDVFLLSQFIKNGHIVGVDMTEQQLNKANEHLEYHLDKFSLNENQIKFHLENIEDLNKINFEMKFNIIISNCVINLCKDKIKVIKDVYNLLEDGGEFYFSDVYSSQRLPENLKNDPVIWGECLGGALYWNDFLNIAKKVGFTDPRLVKSNKIDIKNNELEQKLGGIEFFSATYRLFKLPNLLETDCEDYGQAVIYKGTIPGFSHFWKLDNHHKIISHKVFPVCGNTWNMLYHSRFRDHFEFIGNFDRHYGIFDGCGKAIPFKSNNDNDNRTSCC